MLHVIAVISNPVRYHSRYRLYKQFERYMLSDPQVVLHTVECAYGNRPFAVTDRDNPNHVQVRTNSEIWHKENLINLGIANLPCNWEYMAWIDADVEFLRPNVIMETLEQLQHYSVVQMWSHSVDLGPNFETIGTAQSFGSYYLAGTLPGDPGSYGYPHTGYAWAARREFIDAVGGLLDFAVLGSADFYMAWAIAGRLSKNLYNDVANASAKAKGFNPNYIARLLQWEQKAQRIHGNFGVVEGTLQHYFHGSKKKRYYNTRENILIQNDFDPDMDLTKDWQGLYQLIVENSRQRRIRDQIRVYMRARNEDGTEV